MLNELLSSLPSQIVNPALLVGVETGDDAAVYKINDEQAIIATTDFFMPIVDDPYDFGRIAAANALSDVYATGGKPILALAIAGIPIGQLPLDMVSEIFAGGTAVCHEAGVPIAGGHTIDTPEPIYGLVAIGMVHPDKVMRNADAQPGDVLILGKAIGTGVLSSAENRGDLDKAGYQELVDTTTKLNSVGPALAEIDGVHALTDVTGFGLPGHLYEVCAGSKVAATLEMDKIPFLPSAPGLAEKGYNPGAANNNWTSFGDSVTLPDDFPEWRRKLLFDPQTSGGLLVACDPDDAEHVLKIFRDDGFDAAAIIGAVASGEAHITVR